MNARKLLEALQPLMPRATSGVTVLAYHLVGAGTESPVDIPVATFTEQMAFLRATCRVVSLESALSGGSPAGDGPLVVLTFDDAYRNFRDVVWPILSEMGLPAILYVPVGFVSGNAACPIRGTTLPACSWEDLKALVGEGAAIGSHTVSHVNLVRASRDVVDRELRDSRKELETRLGVSVGSFCYPQAKYTRRVLGQTSSHYDNAVVAGGRRFVHGRDSRHAVPRFPVRRDLRSFENLVHAPIWLSEAAADVVRQRIP